MNDRIIELRKEAYNLVQIDLQTNERDEPVSEREHLKMVFDKFAELIVAECVDFLRDTLDDHFSAEQLEEHFGVEQ
jgi:hypothetical protein